MMNEMMDNMMNEEVIEAAAEEVVQKVDFGKLMKGCGKAAVVVGAVYGVYKFVQPHVAKLKAKKGASNESDVLEGEIVQDVEGEVVK